MIGHQAQRQFFQHAIEHDTLSHAYLLVGPVHVGKRTLVHHVAAGLLGIPTEQLPLQPDVRIIRQERHQKTQALKKDIGISQVRDIRRFAVSGPMSATYNVIIMEDIDLLSTSAANSLLKILEEPHPRTVIYLTTAQLDRVPETIQSRAQIVRCVPVPDDELLVGLNAICTDPSLVTRAIEYAAGLPGIAYAYVTDEARRTEIDAAIDEWHQFATLPLYQKRQRIEPLFAKKADHIEGRRILLERIRIWSLLVRKQLLSDDHRDYTPQLMLMYDTLQETAIRLQQNIHPRAAMDALLLTIP